MITLSDVTKWFASAHGRVEAVKNVTLDVAPERFTSILGPSGCGKTTTLRMIAGFERPDSGRIWLGDQLVYSREDDVDVPAQQRGLGIVFQSYAIWPHMDVGANVAYPLRVRRVPAPQRRKRVEELLDLVGLEGLSDRPATQLSGGEQQRVALARALAAQPAVLLLDEPLSNLDAERRAQMRVELSQLQREVGTTTLYVTHDQGEALAMSDEVVVMDHGRILQRGTPRELYHRPQSRFVATFVGATNLIAARRSRRSDADPGLLETDLGPLRVDRTPVDPDHDGLAVSIRPETMQLTDPDDATATNGRPGSNQFRGCVERSLFLGSRVEHHVRVGATVLRVFDDGRDPPVVDREMVVEVAPEDCQVLTDPPDPAGDAEQTSQRLQPDA